MPDILIRGVRMPVACSDCPSRDVSVCVWTDDYNVESYKFSRPSFCPLHKLPEHGDLIDRDANADVIQKVMKASEGIERHMAEATLKVLNAAPVVIPSNKEDSRTMDEFMCGQECGNPEDGSL